MGISFVSKVAPPQYKGLMQGGWFAATAIGNYLLAIIGSLWMQAPRVGHVDGSRRLLPALGDVHVLRHETARKGGGILSPHSRRDGGRQKPGPVPEKGQPL